MIIGDNFNTYRRLNNTARLGPVGPNFGLGGLFDMTGQATVPGQVDASGNPMLDPAVITAVNSEAVFLLNLYRQATGQPVIPPQNAAPTVNFGLSPDAKNMLMLGGAGLLAVILLAKKRR